MTGVCPSRPLSTAVGFWADSVVVGFLVVCFCCWSWVWSGGAVPLLRLLGRYLGYSPVPGGLHLAVHRGNAQHYEGHTLAEPPSWASQGHSPGSLPSPPPLPSPSSQCPLRLSSSLLSEEVLPWRSRGEVLLCDIAAVF